MKAKTLLSLFASILLGLMASQAAHAQADPKPQLEKTVYEIIDLLHEEDGLTLDQKREKAQTILEDSFSFEILIRRALARNWSKLTDDQRTKIADLISDLLIRAYTRELKNGPKPQINFGDTLELNSKTIEIPSTVTYKNTLVNVSYRLANIPNRGWQLYDVLIEGVSMVSNYRSQFDAHFQTKSADDLITVLQEKLDNFDAS